jgi:hypothetical protein
LSYYGEGDKILIVNNYSSLNNFLKDLKDITAVGVDLEGRLRKNGNIVLI